MKFKLDWDVFATTRLRPRLRIPFWRLFLSVLYKPLVWLHDQFLTRRQITLRRRAYNGQAYRLELMLNSEFFQGYTFDAPPGQPGREVYITTIADTLDRRPLWLLTEETAPPTLRQGVFLRPNSPWHLFRLADFLGQSDFIVFVPAASWNAWSEEKRARFRGWLNRHKLAGKQYQIKPY